MSATSEGYLTFDDWRAFLASNLAAKTWQTVYAELKGDHEDGLVYCALIPNDQITDRLADHCWDVTVGAGHPGISQSGFGPDAKTSYDRLGFLGGVEPLVICRSFHAGAESFREISEEFRLFHNLYQGKKRDEFLKTDDSGTPEVVARLLPNKVEIRTKEIRQFLAVREMHMAIQIDINRFSPAPIDNIPAENRLESIQTKQSTFSRGARPCDFRKPYLTHAYFMGKKLLAPLPKEESGQWPFNDNANETYPTFIVRTDEEGKSVEFTCEEGKLSNYFGANPGAPHYLTPVHFRSEVLSKYYNHPDRYSVEDGYLRAGSLWGLKMDNDHHDRVVVFLGDLGRDLPEAERAYWRTFNVPPNGPPLSKTAFTRSIRGWFADPSRPDLAFKNLLPYFVEKWREKFGWDLFRPLSKDDAHHFTALRIPLNNDQGEFDSQVQSLTKIIIDSLNEAAISEGLTLPSEIKGISKFEGFLAQKGVKEAAVIVSFLRNLQTLRSTGVAHRKGEKYEKIAKVFDLENRELKDVASGLFSSALEMIRSLDRALLPETGGDNSDSEAKS